MPTTLFYLYSSDFSHLFFVRDLLCLFWLLLIDALFLSINVYPGDYVSCIDRIHVLSWGIFGSCSNLTIHLFSYKVIYFPPLCIMDGYMWWLVVITEARIVDDDYLSSRFTARLANVNLYVCSWLASQPQVLPTVRNGRAQRLPSQPGAPLSLSVLCDECVVVGVG